MDETKYKITNNFKYNGNLLNQYEKWAQNEPMEPIFIAIFPFSAYMGTLQESQSIECRLNVIFYSLLSASDKNMCHLKSDHLEIA